MAQIAGRRPRNGGSFLLLATAVAASCVAGPRGAEAFAFKVATGAASNGIGRPRPSLHGAMSASTTDTSGALPFGGGCGLGSRTRSSSITGGSALSRRLQVRHSSSSSSSSSSSRSSSNRSRSRKIKTSGIEAPCPWATTRIMMNAEAVEAVSSTSVDQEEGQDVKGDDTPEPSLESDAEAENTPSKSKRRRGSQKPSHGGPRKVGDVEEAGFSGTRLGFEVLKVFEVPEDAPTDLPEGEDEGYPMLLYQFMHAQYREDFPSQSSARKSVRRKELLLNGEEVRNDVKVKAGDAVTIQKRAQPGLFPQGKPTCTLPIVWEDDYLAVVNKPPGVAVYGGTGEGDPGPGGRRSVRQSLPYTLTPTKSTDRPLHRPLHCHRIDKPTGGLLICAKTRPALSAISEAFEKRLVHKRYVALVGGGVLEGSGAIVTRLDEKDCQTNYRVRGETARSLKTNFITTVDLWPITGRFHQLRRHLSSIGSPILGDKRYTPKEFPFQEGGMFLQAVGLTFPHPITGEEINISIPEPDKFKKWRQKEHSRWLQHHNDGSGDRGGVVEQGMTGDAGGGGGGGGQKREVNALPDVEGLQVEDRDGFRYYQYDWSVVGGPPSPLSIKDIDDTVVGDGDGDDP